MFVCHGNICRSPMAEFIMKKIVSDAGVGDRYSVTSSGVSSEEYGNPIYPPALAELMKHGIRPIGHRAKPLTSRDRDKYDIFIGMDNSNIRGMKRILGEGAPIYKLMSFVGSDADVSDPWYFGGFDKAYSDIHAAAEALFELCESGELL